MPNYKIIFLGTPEFAVPALDALIASGLSPIAVITEPDRPSGRGKKLKYSPIKECAIKYNIPIFQPEKLSTCLPDRQALNSQFSTLNADLGIVVAYGQIIPKEILEIPRLGFINIHPSLLPKYRGPSPIQAAILNSDKETGVTIIKLDEKMDHGPILTQQELEIPITNNQLSNKSQTSTNYQKLSEKLSNLGADLLIKILPDYLEGKIRLKEQDHDKAAYTKLIKKTDGLVNLDESIEDIETKIRAYNPWPGTYTLINGKRFKICQAHCEYDKLVIDQIQPEGKRMMSWDEFKRGYRDYINFLDKKVKI